jgi:hypothetical protein
MTLEAVSWDASTVSATGSLWDTVTVALFDSTELPEWFATNGWDVVLVSAKTSSGIGVFSFVGTLGEIGASSSATSPEFRTSSSFGT